MSEFGEAISLGDYPAVDEDKCPMCNKKKHKKTTKEKEEGKGELKSIPDNLNCETIPQHPDIAFYATAAHHLIPANQCLAKFHRLSQMADEVGYDVNNKKNGLSLPTVGQLNENSYYLEGVKYGDLVQSDKK
ncbi:MAG: AHH domain-containing protein, partial [Pseudomonadales bacterium]|nr:AHH domain-containing protein [Pseudomonadales bacterium]